MDLGTPRPYNYGKFGKKFAKEEKNYEAKD